MLHGTNKIQMKLRKYVKCVENQVSFYATKFEIHSCRFDCA